MKKLTKFLILAFTTFGMASCELMPQVLPNGNNNSSSSSETTSSEEPTKPEEQLYRVSWVNYDGSVLEQTDYKYGAWPTYNGATPYRPSDGNFEYEFTGWSPRISGVKENKTYIAQYQTVGDGNVNPDVFLITWANWDGTILERSEYRSGEWPGFHGAYPSRPSDGTYTYSFTGWSPEISYVYESRTYVAQYQTSGGETTTPINNTFIITWANWDGEVLEQEEYGMGTMPSYHGAVPQREGDGNYSYQFTGWAPNVERVYANKTYVAQFATSGGVSDPTTVQHLITWYNYDGSFLANKYFDYGAMPVYPYEEPTRDQTIDKVYQFTGWTPELEEVTCAFSYKAVFMSSDRQYQVTFHDYDGKELYVGTFTYGERIVYGGSITPTRESDQQYDYQFSGWDREICDGVVDVYPQFSNTLRKYTITWVNYDDSLLAQDEWEYGSWPSYQGETPTKPREGAKKYYFDHWSPYVQNVYQDATYKAEFYSNTESVRIKFARYDGTIISDWWFEYGSPVTINENDFNYYDFVQEGDLDHYYEFVGWDKEIPEYATDDIVLTAQQEERNTVDNLKLKKSSDETHYMVVGYKKAPTSGFIGIPEEYDGLPITEIYKSAFYNQGNRLRKVIMSNNITVIGERAFSSDWNTNFVLSENITTIGNEAFYNCNNFFDDIYLPNIVSIGSGAFSSIWNSTLKITLGSSLEEIGDRAFVLCGREFVIEGEGGKYYTKDSAIYTNDGEEKYLVAYPSFKETASLSIEEGTTKILDSALYYQQYIRRVELPSSLNIIGNQAFNSSRIASITIPENVTSLGQSAFNDCQYLTTVTLNCSINEIPNSCFGNCQMLKEVTLPSSVTTLGGDVFYNCKSLTSIELPMGLETINWSAFRDCESLESIIIPESVTYLDGNVFNNCKSLESITIPEGLTSLRYNTFYNCVLLDTVVLPSTLNYIEDNIFYGCDFLEVVTFNGTMEQWNSVYKYDSWCNNSAITMVRCSDGDITL